MFLGIHGALGFLVLGFLGFIGIPATLGVPRFHWAPLGSCRYEGPKVLGYLLLLVLLEFVGFVGFVWYGL